MIITKNIAFWGTITRTRLCQVLPILIFFLVLGCDSDKYLGYNYDAERLANTASFSGKITNKFTGLPVSSATISINDDQMGFTDIIGNYQLTYVLSEDAVFGKRVPFSVTATKFFTFDTTIKVFPGSIELDFPLEYAAPMIESTVLVFVENEPVCQAIVSDYQGADDMVSAIARFNYIDSNDLIATRLNMALDNIKTPAAMTIYYQGKPPGSIDGYALSGAYTLTVTDKSGFFDVFEHTFNPFSPDTLLFSLQNP